MTGFTRCVLFGLGLIGLSVVMTGLIGEVWFVLWLFGAG